MSEVAVTRQAEIADFVSSEFNAGTWPVGNG
jgi:hypothetical protein